MIQVENLSVNVGRKQILNDVSISIESGSVCCIMGVNGCGKSTLLNTLMGHPDYKIKRGSIFLDAVNITEIEADQKSLSGMFMSFQSPQDFPEITGWECLQMIHSAHNNGQELTQIEIAQQYATELAALKITTEMLYRPFNSGFSGGEKKRMELLQLLVCKPTTILLDEIDTGLDVDSMILIGNTIKAYLENTRATVIIVTHYFRFLEFINPNTVIVMEDGRIKTSGGYELAKQIDKRGYASIEKN